MTSSRAKNVPGFTAPACGVARKSTARIGATRPLAPVARLMRRTQDCFAKSPPRLWQTRKIGRSPDALENHPVEHLTGSIRQRHGVAGVFAGEPQNAEGPGQAGRAGGIAQRPHPNLEHVLPQPMRPRSRGVVPGPPGRERIAAEAVHEHHVGATVGVLAPRDPVQLAQISSAGAG